jgi:hypothetical protein
MATLYLYRFRYLDPLRNKWLMARYAAEREEIAKRYERYELIEPPEVRQIADDWRYPDASRLGRSTAGDLGST